MSSPFNPHHGLVLVPADIEGPSGSASVTLALDTGATRTVVNEAVLRSLGYATAQPGQTTTIVTGSGLVTVPVVTVSRLRVLGQERTNLPIFAHTLPPSTNIDGVVGLDFLRGLTLTVDFRSGMVTLT